MSITFVVSIASLFTTSVHAAYKFNITMRGIPLNLGGTDKTRVGVLEVPATSMGKTLLCAPTLVTSAIVGESVKSTYENSPATISITSFIVWAKGCLHLESTQCIKSS